MTCTDTGFIQSWRATISGREAIFFDRYVDHRQLLEGLLAAVDAKGHEGHPIYETRWIPAENKPNGRIADQIYILGVGHYIDLKGDCTDWILVPLNFDNAYEDWQENIRPTLPLVTA